MYYAEMKHFDVANGPGVRVSLFVSGCPHACPGCFNEIAWNYRYGAPFTEEVEEELLSALSREEIQGLSLLGGEPLVPVNLHGLLPFLLYYGAGRRTLCGSGKGHYASLPGVEKSKTDLYPGDEGKRSDRPL